jgi:hypothetical protein
MTLIELLVAMSIASIIGAMILHLVISFQSRIFTEIGRNDLHDRAERLIRFLASDIREASFMLGPVPQLAEGSSLTLVHDSLPGDPSETLPFSILAVDDAEDDRLTIVKAVSFSPTLYLTQPGLAGDMAVVLNRRPNRSPGSTRELQPAPEAINHLVLAGQQKSYAVSHADSTLQLNPPLTEEAAVGTEVLGVRAIAYQLEPFSDSKRLRRDDFTSRAILDDAVDGLQFEYLLDDGSQVNLPANPLRIRGVRISLLVRDLRADRSYTNTTTYTLGNRSYGPYRDHFRRQRVSRLVEVKNHGLR